jgi:hypothetical protein
MVNLKLLFLSVLKSSKLAFYFDKKFNNERHCTPKYVQIRKMHGGFSISKSVFFISITFGLIQCSQTLSVISSTDWEKNH